MDIIEKYNNAINLYFFQPLTVGELSKDFHEQIKQEFNKNYSPELFQAVKSFLEKFKCVLRDIISLFKELEKYTNPKINEKINLNSYLAARKNNIYQYEFSTKKKFDNLKYSVLLIESLIINDKIKEAIYLKNICINKTGYYKQYLIGLGIDLSKTPFLEYFDSFLYELKNSIDINELRFFEELKYDSIIGYDSEIQNKTSVQSSDIDIELLKYLSLNFSSSDKRFNDLTKYNHIYRFFNEDRDYNIEHRTYKNLIKKLFDFDYLNREIKGQTEKHLTQLKNLALTYNSSKK